MSDDRRAVIPAPVVSVPRLRIGRGHGECVRIVPEETPVALIHDATTTAVMMATPADLEDFAWGFALTEGIVAHPAEVHSVEIVPNPEGVEARMWLKQPAGAALSRRRRMLAGPTGCGLCGVDSLKEARRPTPIVSDRVRIASVDISAALAGLQAHQVLGASTRAVHAAGWWSRAEGLILVREDVGRHNALDKLIGALVRSGRSSDGMLVLTSRVSVEMVQKAAAFGVEVVVAISAPTALAVRTTGAAGITLVAIARDDAFEIFTHGSRLLAATQTP